VKRSVWIDGAGAGVPLSGADGRLFVDGSGASMPRAARVSRMIVDAL